MGEAARLRRGPCEPQGGPRLTHLSPSRQSFTLPDTSCAFLLRPRHLEQAPPLPAQPPEVAQLLPEALKAAKDEQRHVLWQHVVEADERLSGAPREDTMILQLEEASSCGHREQIRSCGLKRTMNSCTMQFIVITKV